MRMIIAALTTVALWAAGIVIVEGESSAPGDKATGQQVLAWAQHHTNPILLGSWAFMLGCVCFIWFAAELRSRLAEAEGGHATISTALFGGALGVAILGLTIQGGDVAIALNKSSMPASAAGALYRLTDVFFVGAELVAIVPLAALAVLAFRTAVVPRWWGVVSAVIAVVLAIGPIGWAGLMFGVPLWTLVTSGLIAFGRPVTAPRFAPVAA
jgi:hypothetical protein